MEMIRFGTNVVENNTNLPLQTCEGCCLMQAASMMPERSRVAKLHTNPQIWFGGRLWPKNEEGFVGSALIPFSWESGNQFMNR